MLHHQGRSSTKLTDATGNITSDGSGALPGDALEYSKDGVAVKVTGEVSLDQLKAIDAVTDKADYSKLTDTATNIKSDGSGALTGDAATYVNAGVAVKVTGEASLDQLKAIDAVTDKADYAKLTDTTVNNTSEGRGALTGEALEYSMVCCVKVAGDSNAEKYKFSCFNAAHIVELLE